MFENASLEDYTILETLGHKPWQVYRRIDTDRGE